MYKPFALFVGLRYTRSRRRSLRPSLVTFASIIIISVGVIALITVMSVMNGFEKEVRERILDAIAHITVTDFDGRIEKWEEVMKLAKEHPKVVAAAPFINAETMVIHRGNVEGTLIRGIMPKDEKSVSKISQRIIEGSYDSLVPGKFNIILGVDLARILSADVGDKITLVTPSANITPAGVTPRMKRFTVSGIFKVGHYDYDSKLAVIHLEDAARLLKMKGKASGVQIQIQDQFQAGQVRNELQSTSGLNRYLVKDWSQLHANWFRAVANEKRMIFFLLFLIMFVAAISIIMTLILMVKDKQSDIAILRTLGAAPADITNIFLVLGTFIGTVGTLVGVTLGVILAINVDSAIAGIEKLLGIHFLDPSVYYISELPSDLRWSDVVDISAFSFLLGVVTTIIPAYLASKVQPAQALRYE
ncbi:MAG: lipoprotein-releasing ABC transporter permease subunit [Gammaproteobacteria bacterium]|nr:lipoprotein-releasing ABC transporter permease subunit [Gammaproteobacteria bacterium]MDH5652653.1 lipoprotein-releasing ABC transporter permease subunit [Gammaproteobacteria bacterium]